MSCEIAISVFLSLAFKPARLFTAGSPVHLFPVRVLAYGEVVYCADDKGQRKWTGEVNIDYSTVGSPVQLFPSHALAYWEVMYRTDAKGQRKQTGEVNISHSAPIRHEATVCLKEYANGSVGYCCVMLVL